MAYGYAPYQESGFKAALRQALAGGGFQASLSGLGAVPRGANFGTALLAAAGGAARATSAADQAARDYAMRQALAEQQRQHQAVSEDLMRAQIENYAKQKPEKLEPYQLPPEKQAAIIDFEARKAKALAAAKGTTGAGGEMPGLSNEALDAAAQRYAITGLMPAMGMGKQAAAYRAEIMNRAGKKFPQSNIAANAASYRTDTASLGNIQKLYDAATAWEGTANSNADVMLSALKGIPETGTRFGNKIARMVASQTGSPAMARFHAAQETLRREYARLLSSPAATGVLTDTSVKELGNILSGDLTKKQYVASLQTLKRDATNRRKAYSGQTDVIRKRILANPVAPFQGAPQTAGQENQSTQNWVYDPDTGELVPAQ